MEDNRRFRFRSNIILTIFSVCLIGFVFLLHNAQIVNGSTYLAQSNIQRTTSKTIVSSRGIITDRNGKVLVSNKEVYTITFDPKAVPVDTELVPDDAALSKKRSVALAVYRLIALCRSRGWSGTTACPLPEPRPLATPWPTPAAPSAAACSTIWRTASGRRRS